MSQIRAKRQKISNEFRQVSRQQIRKKIRQTMQCYYNSKQFPLISNTLSLFWELNHFNLTQANFKIIEQIQNTQFSQLQDQQHRDLVIDLLYLIHQHVIIIPPGLKFKKNEDPTTAVLVAYISELVDEEELLYWLNYMNDQEKDLIFFSINAQQPSHQKWIKNDKLFQIIIEETSNNILAVQTLKELLQFSQYISIAKINSIINPLHNSLRKSRQSSSLQLQVVLGCVWMTILSIQIKIAFNRQTIDNMISILKEVLSYNLHIFQQTDTVTLLNSLYDSNPEDYLVNDDSCEYIVHMIASKMKNNEISDMVEGFDYYTNGIYTLCYNNWRIKQLYNKTYHYSTQFYNNIESIQKGQCTSPYYSKLLKIKRAGVV